MYMHNTKGDVVLMNSSRETKYFHDFVPYPNKSYSLLVSLGSTLFVLGHPNKIFRFPSPSTRKVGLVGRIKKNNQKKLSK